MKRRTLVGAAGVAVSQLLGGRVATAETNDVNATVVDLRVLETSDLHMFAYDYDYYNGRQDDTVGETTRGETREVSSRRRSLSRSATNQV